MSNEAMGAAFKLRFNNPSARLVLFSLADHHNRSSGKCCPAITTIMADTCLSRSTVKRALFWLQGKPDPKEKKREFSPVPFIKREENFDQNGRQTADRFTLLFMEGVQSEPGGGQSEPGEGFTREPGEGFNHEPPLKRTLRRNHKKEQESVQQAARQPDLDEGLFPTKPNEDGWQPSFEKDFWKPYPRKKGKKASLTLWNTFRTEKRRAACLGLSHYLETEDVKRGFIKTGENYLRDEPWLDDDDDQPAPKAPAPGVRRLTAEEQANEAFMEKLRREHAVKQAAKKADAERRAAA
jgi:Helix-turn-helix domain